MAERASGRGFRVKGLGFRAPALGRDPARLEHAARYASSSFTDSTNAFHVVRAVSSPCERSGARRRPRSEYAAPFRDWAVQRLGRRSEMCRHSEMGPLPAQAQATTTAQQGAKGNRRQGYEHLAEWPAD